MARVYFSLFPTLLMAVSGILGTLDDLEIVGTKWAENYEASQYVCYWF